MKFPLDWHREGLRNSEDSYSRRLREVARLQDENSRLWERIEFMRKQLEEAERRELTEYDPDRLLAKRGSSR